MIILGIDPGTIVMGYGIIESENDDASLIEFGAISPEQGSPIAERLCHLHDELRKIIRRHHPEAVAVEQPFIARNVRSAMAIGRAQAIALLAAAEEHLTTYEYTPTQIKQRVANYGASSKEQVQEMVKLQLGLDEIPEPDDAADALAVAICHLRETHLNRLLAEGTR